MSDSQRATSGRPRVNAYSSAHINAVYNVQELYSQILVLLTLHHCAMGSTMYDPHINIPHIIEVNLHISYMGFMYVNSVHSIHSWVVYARANNTHYY